MENSNKYAVMLEDRQAPAKLWDSYELAEKEAERLAKREKTTTYVLIVVAKTEIANVKTTLINPDALLTALNKKD